MTGRGTAPTQKKRDISPPLSPPVGGEKGFFKGKRGRYIAC